MSLTRVFLNLSAKLHHNIYIHSKTNKIKHANSFISYIKQTVVFGRRFKHKPSNEIGCIRLWLMKAKTYLFNKSSHTVFKHKGTCCSEGGRSQQDSKQPLFNMLTIENHIALNPPTENSPKATEQSSSPGLGVKAEARSPKLLMCHVGLSAFGLLWSCYSLEVQCSCHMR